MQINYANTMQTHANTMRNLRALYLHEVALYLHFIFRHRIEMHYNCIIFALHLHKKVCKYYANTTQLQCKHYCIVFA